MSQAPGSFWLPNNSPGAASMLSPMTQGKIYTITSPPPPPPQPSQQPPHLTPPPTLQHLAPGSLAVFKQFPPPSFGPHLSLAPAISHRPPSKWDMISPSLSSCLNGPHPRSQAQDSAYPSPNVLNSYERLGTYRSLTSALTGTRALQSIEKKIDRIEALTYQKDTKAVTTFEQRQDLSQDQEALKGMMQSCFEGFLGQMAESVGQTVRREVGQYLDTLQSAMGKDFNAAQEVVIVKLQDLIQQDRMAVSCEIKTQLQRLLESDRVEGTIRHQVSEEYLAKLLNDRSAAIQGMEQKRDRHEEPREQHDGEKAQDILNSIQELREVVEKLAPILHTLETNDLSLQRDMRCMISGLQQEFETADLARRLDKDKESKRNVEADESLDAIETRVAELMEDFLELGETLRRWQEDLVKEIESIKRRQDEILMSLQENHRQQQQYLESRLQSPSLSEAASGATLVNAPQTASTARQRSKRLAHGTFVSAALVPSDNTCSIGGGNPDALMNPSSNNNNDHTFKNKRIKIEPGTVPKPAERTMTTRMMSKVLKGIIT